MTDAPSPETRRDVELRLPADGVFVSVLRTTAAAIAARLDFTMDDIEDLRICVGEAGALVIPVAAAGSAVSARFGLDSTAVRVELSGVRASPDDVPDRESFAWQVLDTVADGAVLETDGDRVRVSFTVTSERAAEGGGSSG